MRGKKAKSLRKLAKNTRPEDIGQVTTYLARRYHYKDKINVTILLGRCLRGIYKAFKKNYRILNHLERGKL